MATIMQQMKKIEHTLSPVEMLRYARILTDGINLPDYFGIELQTSDNNSKTGFGTINNPALLSCLIGLSCNGLCYACNNYYTMDQTEIPRVSNLILYLTDYNSYREQLFREMRKRRIIRMNDSGDLIDYKQLEMIYNGAIKTRCNVQIFTKKHYLVNMLCREYGEDNNSLIEKGIYILFSTDPKIVNMNNPYGFKIADIV